MSPPITIATPLPAEDLLFESMTVTAGFSSLGEMQINLLSPKPDLKPEDLLGKPVTVTVQQRNDAARFFNGYVTRFGIGANRGRYFAYQATVNPWLWFLTRTADCRIFQELSVPDIVKRVFEDHGIANFEFKTFRTYRKWVYCVQYRESDYNFVARLMEHEGIYWYFTHADGEHKLLLVDSQSAHDPAPSCPSLPFIEHGAATAPDTDFVSDWTFSRGVRTGKVAMRSYDFERPSTDLTVKADKMRPHGLSDYEVFDYQGDYVKAADGTQWAEDRVDELQTSFQSLSGSSNAQGIEVGRLLGLTRHPRDDQNADYLITALSVSASVDGLEAGNAAGGYRCSFSAIPSNQQFRPQRRTPKPFMQGPQTAVVVGPSGEELFTDKYGRVKVQFFWDRKGRKDEKSSCWVRVSHPSAGKNFGMVHVPRIGQEVVIHFLEGDPDQPLITGRVYNAEQMPPWDLPANATQSGILTRSSKGGAYGHANAIRFEDKKGAEQLWLHAEKDQLIEVENDEVHSVGVNRTIGVGGNHTETIKGDTTIKITEGKLVHEVVAGTSYSKAKGALTIESEESITLKVGGNVITINKDGTITVVGSSDVKVKGSKLHLNPP